MAHISMAVPTMAKFDDDTSYPRAVRIAGPLFGYRLGVTDAPARIYNLTLDGCLVELSFGTVMRQASRLQIDLPGEGWTIVYCDTLHLAGPNTFAVQFRRLDEETRSRIARALARLGDRPPEDRRRGHQRGGQ